MTTNTVQYTKTQQVFNQLAEAIPLMWLICFYAVGAVTAVGALIAFGNLALAIPSGLGYEFAWDIMWDQRIQHTWATTICGTIVVVALLPTIALIMAHALYVVGYCLRHGHLPPSNRER